MASEDGCLFDDGDSGLLDELDYAHEEVATLRAQLAFEQGLAQRAIAALRAVVTAEAGTTEHYQARKAARALLDEVTP
jgi:hypothetical protein